MDKTVGEAMALTPGGRWGDSFYDALSHFIGEVHIPHAEDLIGGNGGEMQRGAEQMGLEVVVLVQQSGLLWIFAGQVIHGGQGVPSRPGRVGLLDRALEFLHGGYSTPQTLSRYPGRLPSPLPLSLREGF